MHPIKDRKGPIIWMMVIAVMGISIYCLMCYFKVSNQRKIDAGRVNPYAKDSVTITDLSSPDDVENLEDGVKDILKELGIIE